MRRWLFKEQTNGDERIKRKEMSQLAGGERQILKLHGKQSSVGYRRIQKKIKSLTKIGSESILNGSLLVKQPPVHVAKEQSKQSIHSLQRNGSILKQHMTIAVSIAGESSKG